MMGVIAAVRLFVRSFVRCLVGFSWGLTFSRVVSALSAFVPKLRIGDGEARLATAKFRFRLTREAATSIHCNRGHRRLPLRRDEGHRWFA